MTQKDQLNLKENSTPRPSKRREIPPSTSVVTEDHIYGRKEVAEAVLQLLISDKHSDALTKVPNVIPIVGMGGIGKTTLAQLVYNDKKLQSFFDMKAWACVSEDFNVATVTITILQSVISENCDGKDLNWMQVTLKKNLLGKKFLVILDDVWNEKYNDWILLRTPFEAGAPGSSIIVTTRNQGVSSLMGTIKVEPFQLELLPIDACLSIFSQHALDAKDFSAHPDLKDVGEEIVRKCKGLPLAVKTVGGLLHGTQDSNEWEKVLQSKIWNIPEEKSGIAPALMLSYHNLPAHLKRCFAYCSIFPKDYEFEEKEVVLLWMAEGLIHRRHEDEEEMEDLGSEYFRNLLSRSFFQESHFYKSKFFMHDLINDLAQSVAGETCFRMEDRVGGSQHGVLPIKARHSSYLGSQYDVTKKFEGFSKLISLRTFLPFKLSGPGDCYLARRVSHELVPTLGYLRVLSFNGYRITELSDSISGLKHLRYLNLSETEISSLPESIATIYNLQTLLLENCRHLKKLPSMLCNLVNLRHLNIEGANCLEGMPVQIAKLTCLQTLSNLIVGKDNCSGVKELGPLNHLRKVKISRLENVIEPKDANDAELIKKIKIRKLSLGWSHDIDESKDRTSELEVLNGLQPHGTLTELGIINYGGTKFPNWLTPPSFPHMVSLEISKCRKCTLLPPLGQLPSLKTLSISGVDSVKSVGSEFCGGNLETLDFDDMKEWENWSPCEEFSNLRELSLHKCPKLLGKLPNNLPVLKYANIYNCKMLVLSLSCFPDKCRLSTDIYRGVVCGSKVIFKSINEGHMEGLAELESLTIKNCEELRNLCSDNMGSLPHLPFLRALKISSCPKLVSLVVEEVDQEASLQLRITYISIQDCIALESLPRALMYNNTCLQSIFIFNCDSLTHFARSHLPPTLKKLHIRDCKSMRNLVEDDDIDTNNNSTTCSSGNTSHLEVLDVSNCPSLESLTLSGELPTTLQRLYIYLCPKLKLVAKSFHHNSFLETITISECENLQLLNGGELLLPSNLRELYIFNCEKMQGLQNGIYDLTSLQALQILYCPSILSFPKQGFPTNLTILNISRLEITEALFDWGLDNLTSLKELSIVGCQHLVSFPKMTLPASLTILHIEEFLKLECLSSEGLRKLTSLKTLVIFDCDNLACFPEDGLPPSLLELDISYCKKLMSFPKNGLPPSLLKLWISDCPNLRSFPKDGLPPSLLNLRIFKCKKLRSFPKNGLPPSLQQLAIDECPLLEKWCKKGEWCKIADIPYVEINYRYIYGTETEE
ncbi:putative disease resistance protein At3g14460 [Juglans regia]|nr:putative disease resistance protein At3g14460 [Juglans regia]XP_035541985.1 putative disease resistance protein At3g14460 [Juglans regia]XP_035541986.1 putative disease resistance protein At3g14460 [Juglans regia]